MKPTLTNAKKLEMIALTQKWVETFIIGLNLCPFAKAPYLKKEVRFTVTDADSMQDFVQSFANELSLMDEDPSVETTLMIVPRLGDIEYFQPFIKFCEETIVLNNWTKSYQIVSFHPFMRFDGIEADSPRNLTGMSPYPVLHILRVASVEGLGKAVKKDVQIENDKKLSAMSKEEVHELWQKLLD